MSSHKMNISNTTHSKNTSNIYNNDRHALETDISNLEITIFDVNNSVSKLDASETKAKQ